MLGLKEAAARGRRGWTGSNRADKLRREWRRGRHIQKTGKLFTGWLNWLEWAAGVWEDIFLSFFLSLSVQLSVCWTGDPSAAKESWLVQCWLFCSQEVVQNQVLEAKVFHSPYGTGLAIVTGSSHFTLATNIDELKLRRLPEVPGQ